MIIGRNKNALENHFDWVAELEAKLLKKGDTDRLSKVQYSTDLADIHFVRQGDPKGLGHAVLRAQDARGRRAVRGAARRRPDRRARPAADADDRGAEPVATPASSRCWRSTPTSIHLYGVGRRRGDRRPTTWCASPGSSRSPPPGRPVQPRHHRPLRAAARGLRHPGAHRARQGRRDPADGRAAGDGRDPGADRRRVRRDLPRSPLRHRR